MPLTPEQLIEYNELHQLGATNKLQLEDIHLIRDVALTTFKTLK